MNIGQLLKQARLEKGLSQRQLCGDTITRNMLSQIENGSARPSMDTLRILASRLDKPISYFLDEPRRSPDEAALDAARQAFTGHRWQEALDALSTCSHLTPETFLLEALSLLQLAQQAIAENKLPYARSLLQKASQAGAATPYYTPEQERRRLLLCCRADPEHAAAYIALLPDMVPELLARASIAEPERCIALLQAVTTPEAQLLKGKAYLQQQNYTAAATCLRHAEEAFPAETAPALEICYRELGDFQQAYLYACKTRDRK